MKDQRYNEIKAALLKHASIADRDERQAALERVRGELAFLRSNSDVRVGPSPEFCMECGGKNGDGYDLHISRCLNCGGELTTGGCVRCGGGYVSFGPQITEPIQRAPALMGWECPRCRTIHAPHVASCWCPAPSILSTGTSPDAPSTQPTPTTPEERSSENPDTPGSLS